MRIKTETNHINEKTNKKNRKYEMQSACYVYFNVNLLNPTAKLLRIKTETYNINEKESEKCREYERQRVCNVYFNVKLLNLAAKLLRGLIHELTILMKKKLESAEKLNDHCSFIF